MRLKIRGDYWIVSCRAPVCRSVRHHCPPRPQAVIRYGRHAEVVPVSLASLLCVLPRLINKPLGISRHHQRTFLYTDRQPPPMTLLPHPQQPMPNSLTNLAQTQHPSSPQALVPPGSLTTFFLLPIAGPAILNTTTFRPEDLYMLRRANNLHRETR